MNKYFIKVFILFVLFPFFNSLAQNSNLLLEYFAGSYNSMGGSGLAAVRENSSFDINPAVLTIYSSKDISISQNFKYYNYSLQRNTNQVGAIMWDWNSTKINFEQVSMIYPFNQKLCLGIGIFQKLDPQLVNKRRAITFSDLFSQETKGNLYAAALSIAYKINEHISVGVNVYDFFGNISSKVTGDNHGNDIDKWVYLENKLNGINFRSGLLLKEKNWSAGLIFETPFKMKLNVLKDISDNQLFNSLLPLYDQTDWNLPWVIGFGLSYNGYNNWLFEIDLEHRQYKNSIAKFNLYEFGGLPVWEGVNILRAGVEYFTNSNLKVPIRAGYAYIPQLYYSNDSVGFLNSITGYSNTDRNIKHLFTLGTTILYNYFTFNFNLEYSIVRWHRTLFTSQIVNDDYVENSFIFATEISFKLN